MINFFESTIYIDILILKGSYIKVVNNDEVLAEGLKESCMSAIRQLVNNIPGKESKTFVFNVKNMTVSESVHEMDKAYFKDQLLLLSTSCTSDIVVNVGLYNLFV